MAIAHQPGDIIQDKYRIIDILGKGSVGITYKAVNLTTKSTVAIKFLSLEKLKDWKKIELFQREAEVLAKLEHPAIPSYLDYFDIETDTDKAFYLVQQQAPGKSLFELVESGWRSTEKEVKNIAQQILEILIYLHSLDPPVIHRDIKPNNLIRSDEGKIYLVDFGAVQNTYYHTLMQGSTVVGTYGYMAPEQFRGKAVPATDLYSLGATILYLLTHRSPAELPQDTLKLDFRDSVAISEGFADWLEKILEPDLDDRFPDAKVALSMLFVSNKLKLRGFITHLGIGFLCLSFLWGFSSYKWWILIRLGYVPSNICTDYRVMHKFFQQGGDIDVNLSMKHIPNKFRSINAREIEPLDSLSCIALNSGYDSSRSTYDVLRYSTHDQNLKLIKNIFLNSKKIDFQKIDKGNNRKYLIDRHLLYVVLLNSNSQELDILMARGANIDTRNKDGRTPLFSSENKDEAQLLINNGADVNAKDKQGRTPLTEAVVKRNRVLVHLFIDSDADINYLNYETIKKIYDLSERQKIQIENFLSTSQFNNRDSK